MKNIAMIAISAAALTLSACGKKDEAAAPATTSADTTGAGTTAAMPAMSAGQTFANAAAASDAFEIETSRLAADKAASAKIKTFASHMIEAHTGSTAKLKAAAAAASPAIIPSPQLTDLQQRTLDELKAKSGADFDTAYAKAQVEAHQMTLDTLKAYAASGDVPSLKAFATETVPVVTAHLNTAKGL